MKQSARTGERVRYTLAFHEHEAPLLYAFYGKCVQGSGEFKRLLLAAAEARLGGVKGETADVGELRRELSEIKAMLHARPVTVAHESPSPSLPASLSQEETGILGLALDDFE